ncbi:hypothetical protein B8133_26635, partial [Salmonella enterica]|nr:hypothetical protein [Salmonella enterica]
MAAGDAVKQQQALDDIYKLQYQRRFLQVLVGVVAGSPDTAITQQTLVIAATKMREETIKNSFIFPGVIDQNDTKLKDVLSNVSGKSDGSYDGIKAGGARLGLDVVCGKSNERCKTQTDPSGKKIMGEDGRAKLEYNAQGMVIFTGDEKFKTLKELLGNKDMFAQLSGATGGNQGRGGPWRGGLMNRAVSGTPWWKVLPA